MKKRIFALLLSLTLLCSAAVASAGVYGHFISEDGTFLFILKDAINERISGVYIGNGDYLMDLDRADREDGSIRLYTPIDESGAMIELVLRYEDDSSQAALATGYINRFNNDGTLMEDQSNPDMQDVRFVRQEVPDVSDLKGTLWMRYTMTISGADRTYPFDGSMLQFFDTEENLGQIPDNAVRTYPFTYEVVDDTLVLTIDVGGELTEATVRIESDVLIVTIQNSTLYFLPSTL